MQDNYSLYLLYSCLTEKKKSFKTVGEMLYLTSMRPNMDIFYSIFKGNFEYLFLKF